MEPYLVPVLTQLMFQVVNLLNLDLRSFLESSSQASLIEESFVNIN